MFFPLGIIFLVVALILIGVGLSLGIFLFALTSAAIVLGVISTSIACGIIQKKPSTGFRVFFYQFFMLSFAAAAVFVSWLISSVFDMQLSLISISVIGSISGLSVGLLFGLLHSWIVDFASCHLQRIFSRTTNAA